MQISSNFTAKAVHTYSASAAHRREKESDFNSYNGLRGAMILGGGNSNFGDTAMVDKEALEGDEAANLHDDTVEETGGTPKPFLFQLFVGALILAILVILTLSWM